jgi:hypothetical protein
MLDLLASIIMSRTTLDIDAPILDRLRERAAAEGKSMGQVASETLAVGLREQVASKPHPLRWPSQRMGKPLIDIDDKEALWRMLDEEHLRKLAR